MVLLFIPDEDEAARWVDANLRARETVQKRRELNYLERRSIEEIDMSVDELLQLTEGRFCSCFCHTSPASILYKSIAGRYRPVSYPDGPITVRYRFIKNA